MDDVIPGVCYPLFMYLIVSLSGILGIMLRGGKNAGMVTFLVFAVTVFASLALNMTCFHGWAVMSWVISFAFLALTSFLISDERIGGVDMVGYVGSVVAWIVAKAAAVYRGFRYITASK